MSKDSKIYLDDILQAIERIEGYTRNMNLQKFSQNHMAIDAVIRNLAIIGEAVKNLPSEIKKKYPETEWGKIAGLRDILVHKYSEVKIEIIWDIITNKILPLKEAVEKIGKE